MSKWIVLTSASDPHPKVFMLKDDIEYISTTTVNGVKQTVVTAKIRGRTKAFAVLQSAKEIFHWI